MDRHPGSEHCQRRDAQRCQQRAQHHGERRSSHEVDKGRPLTRRVSEASAPAVIRRDLSSAMDQADEGCAVELGAQQFHMEKMDSAMQDEKIAAAAEGFPAPEIQGHQLEAGAGAGACLPEWVGNMNTLLHCESENFVTEVNIRYNLLATKCCR